MEWERILTNPISDKESISETLKTQQQRDPIKKWAKDLKRHLPLEGLQVTDKHLERCSTSLVLKEIQNHQESRPYP